MLSLANKMTFCSMHNRGCKPKTLAGLDTTLAMVYLYDNHSGIQPIAAYERHGFLQKIGSIARE
jgi:hypothetical protein